MSRFATTLRKLLPIGTPASVGLDIGAASVKVVSLQGNGGGRPKLTGIGRARTAPNCVVDGRIQDPRGLGESIRAAFEDARLPINGQPATIGLRGLSVVYKRLLLPFQNGSEMDAQLLVEAQQQIDSDLTDWEIDYQVLTQPDAQGQVAVMLVAANRKVVEEYAALLKDVGLETGIVDCDVFAMENSFQQSLGESDESVLCVDIGRDGTRLNLLHEGIPLVVRNCEMGGAVLSESIGRALGISFDQAEALKIAASNDEEMGHGGSAEVEGAIDWYIRDLCQEIQRTLDFFGQAQNDVKLDGIDRVILSGGGARAKGLAHGLSGALKAPVAFSNPFHSIEVPRKLLGQCPDLEHAPFLHGVSLGLALRYPKDKPA